MKIVISSGHGKYIRGARGNPVPPQLDEVDEARKVVEQVATYLRELGVSVTTYHDDVSRTQNENLKRLCDFHNAQGPHDYDVSVHFNAYDGTAHGTECLYITQSELASDVAAAVAAAGQLTNRGGKKRTDLYFLNNTAAPAILIETCFCDNTGDSNLYRANFARICSAIADTIGEEAVAPTPPAGALLTSDEVDAIIDAAASSSIARYSWQDRGTAPLGYVKGMAVAYGTVVRKFQNGHSAAIEMSRANSEDDDVDALAWYEGEFDDLGMSNQEDGLDTLRHLWVLLMGLGMRESSGRYCEGRDMSADNVTSDTAEAGLFQSSWNFHNSCDEIDDLMNEYEDDNSNCHEQIFSEEVSCSSSDWSIYGSGEGAAYQDLAKHCPAFACESTAVGLRKIRQHWGPINRHEAELRPEADQLFMQVEAILAAEPVPPEPIENSEVDINITAVGPVTIRVNGRVIT